MTAPTIAVEDRLQARLREFEGGLDPDWRFASDPHPPLLVWRFFERDGAPIRPQGWKVHVSACLSELPALFESVLPFIVRSRQSFKIAADSNSWINLNQGLCGSTQLGKIITIYPDTDDLAYDLACRLDEIWPSSNGPVVPSDLAVRRNGAIGLRYGTHAPSRRTVDARHGTVDMLVFDGLEVADTRSMRGVQPAGAMGPSWTKKLFRPDVYQTPRAIAFEPWNFQVVDTLVDFGGKQVMICHDYAKSRTVVAKRAVRGFKHGPDGIDERATVRGEYEKLLELSQSLPWVKRPVGFLDRELDAIALLEFVAGRGIGQLPAEERLPAIHGFLARLVELHALPVCHGDIKPTNIICGPDGSVVLIDFETAGRPGAPASGRHTAGFIAGEHPDAHLTLADDVFAAASTIASTLTTMNSSVIGRTVQRQIPALAGLLSRAQMRILAAALSRDPGRRPSAADLLAAFSVAPAPARPPAIPSPRRTSDRRRWAGFAALVTGMASRRFRAGEDPAWRTSEGPLEDGLLRGNAGVALGLLIISQEVKTDLFAGDIYWAMDRALSRAEELAAGGLFAGQGGIALAALCAGSALERPALIDRATALLEIAFARTRTPNLGFGKAGLVFAAAAAGLALRRPVAESAAAAAVADLLESFVVEDGIPVWRPCADFTQEAMTANHTFAYGSAGILWALMQHATVRSDTALAARVVDLADGLAGALWERTTALEELPVWRALLGPERQAEFQARLRELIKKRPPLTANWTWWAGAAGQLDAALALEASDPEGGSRLSHAAVARLRMLRVGADKGKIWLPPLPDEPSPSLSEGFLGPGAVLARFYGGRRFGFMSLDNFAAAAASMRAFVPGIAAAGA